MAGPSECGTMTKRVQAILVMIVMLASSCAGSAEVTDIDRDETAAAEPTAPQVEPTAPTQVEAAATAAPEPTATVPPRAAPPAQTPTAAPESVESRDDTSPPPRPTRLCTTNVEITEELNLRSRPALDAPIVFGIPGESCRMRALGAASDGWVEVVYETQNIALTGFVSTDFATEDQPPMAWEWFDRMVAGEDTSDIADQERVQRWLDFHPFPVDAYRFVSFDDGDSRPCRPVGPGLTGCPVFVLDRNDNVITPMQIEIGEVVVDNEQGAAVVGFNLCFGTEDCIDVDFFKHDRIVVDESQTLAGVPLGTTTDEAVDQLIATFGPPTEDTTWIVGCPLDSEELLNERYLTWGSLTAGFTRDDDGAAGRFHYWSYQLEEDRRALPDGPQPAEIRLPPGTALNMNISEASKVLPSEQFVNEIVQVQQLTADAWTLYGSDFEVDTRITQIGVPFIPLCD